MVEELTKNFKRGGVLHHAYLVEGDRDIIVPELFGFIEKELGISSRGNPDVLVFEYETFGIDEGRYIKNLESLKPVAGTRKIFIIAFHFITREAQNAFLKLFEEPNPSTHFFIITRSAEVLLPTLRSRLQVLTHFKENKSSELAKAFLKAVPGKRMDLVKKMLEMKDKHSVISFLDALERELYAPGSLSFPGRARIFEEIQKVRGYAGDTGALLKMLLEHLALMAPAK